MKKFFVAIIAFLLLQFNTYGLNTALALSVDLSSPDATLNTGDFNYNYYVSAIGGSSQKIFYAGFSPSENSAFQMVVHSIRDNDGNTTMKNVLDIAKNYESTTGNKVMAAVNGDFFYSNGTNVDSYVSDRYVLTQGNLAQKNAFGFDNLGNYAIGRMTKTDLKICVTIDGKKKFFNVDKLNGAPDDGQLAVYTSGKNITVMGAAKYKIKIDSVNLNVFPVYGSSKRASAGEMIDDNTFSINTGEFVVVIKGDNSISKYFYDNLNYGVSCDYVKVPSGDFVNMTYIVGGYDKLVFNGVVNTSTHTDNSGNVAAPRTFVGVKADGTLFFTVIDGRQIGYSIGLTVADEAILAKSFGAVDALELDGGGSSTFVLRKGNELQIVNKPSNEQPARVVSNALLITFKPTADDNGGDNGGKDIDKDNESKESESGCFSSLNKKLYVIITLITISVLILITKSERKERYL